MRKIVISILVLFLVFSELSVSIAETIMGNPTESEIECEEQLESDGEENLATECKEPESENGEVPTTEGEKQPESESDEAPTTEDKKQPETENGEAPTTEGEKEPEAENGEAPTTEEEGQQESDNEEKPAVECEEELATDCEEPEESDSEENLVVKLDNDGEYIDDGYRITGSLISKDSQPIILYYKIDDNDEKKIAEYENADTDATVPWEYTILDDEVKKGLDHDITIYAENESGVKSNEETIKIRPVLTISEQVFDEGGNEIEEVAPEETVSYKIAVETDYIEEDTGTYGEVNITQEYATRLEQPTDLKVSDEDGNEIGTAIYNDSVNVIETTLHANLPRSTKINITYNAKVKKEMEEEDYIISQTTASGRYSTGDAVNRTLDETKILIASQHARINIVDVGPVGNIDFSPLVDPNELDGFTQMEVNEGQKFTSKSGSSDRSYYMAFGDLDNTRSVNSLTSTPRVKGDDWLRPLPTMETSLSSLVEANGSFIRADTFVVATTLDSIPNAPGGVITYYYDNGRPGWGTGNNSFSGLEVVHGNSPDDVANIVTRDEFPIIKLYKNEQANELIAYAVAITYKEGGSAAGSEKYLDGLVKIKMSLKSKKGRVNVSVKYLKLHDEFEYTNLGYSVHMDIGGRHQYSKMFSLGANEGIYFNEKEMKDYKPYYLFFYRDGYANHPAELIARDWPIRIFTTLSYPHGLSHGFFSTLNASSVKDIGEDEMYPYTEHPAWALRWEPEEQGYKEIREVNLEIAVADKKDPAPVIKLDNDGEYTEDGYHLTGSLIDTDLDSEYIGLYYTIDDSEPLKIKDYEKITPGTEVSWEYSIPSTKVKKGLDHNITVYAINEYDQTSNIEEIKIRPDFSITQEVLGEDGIEVKEVAPEETLNFKILAETGYIAEDEGTYGQITITQKHNTHLESPTDLKAIDEDGNEIRITYNSSTNTIEVKPEASLKRSKKIYITYKAKVKKEAVYGQYVEGQATAVGKYSTGDEVNQTSNEVKTKISGVLKFVSAPGVIGFGEKPKISSRTKTYQLIQIDESLSVKDSRALSRNPSWMMTAKLVKPLTGKKNNDSTLDGLYYRYGGNVSTLTKDASALVYKKKTTGKEEINISNAWTPEGDGLYLEVPAGTAKADAYDGTVQWILQNVPVNE
ncbi:hypothetical protein [Lysinibacillus xylanilyticus]|uniref:hypothetical protein n=1 Tax=Lysinibacillus xylanilyticus TaxID=582475 RepID=UPI0037F4B187